VSVQIITGDCLDVLRTLPDCSVDAIVTDPPYGLSFMGKRWDYDVPSVEVWAECLRVLKPGGHLLAFAGTRTQHRMAVRIEDAGFEIRDMIAWVYGSGFPKSHNGPWGGTALKPALEPITVARKPLAGTVAENVQRFGTGALNIDGCRVGDEGGTQKQGIQKGVPNGERAGMALGQNISFRCEISKLNACRWPANLIHDGSDEVLAAFPQAKVQQGALTGAEPSSKIANAFGEFAGRAPSQRRNDTGSAARFFYCAKASKRDRDEGLDAMPTVTADPYGQHRGRRMDGNDTRIDGKPAAQGKNHHPTVKPTDLMRYLCRLVTPPGGVVLDPFTGSGSTGKAAILEGFRFIGIEREPEYVAIAEARIAAAQETAEKASEQDRQPDLFGSAA
jgi:site-specific DNA-methyltransferase (adenine-specific)